MPPQTDPIPRPVSTGDDAMRYLEAYGLTARIPTIRSSDYDKALTDPFRFYLTRRLGLTDCLSYSAALNQGSWFHERFYHWDSADEQCAHFLQAAFDNRITEIDEICEGHGIGAEGRSSIIHQEEQDFLMAAAWWTALSEVPLPFPGPQRQTLTQWMNQPYWRDLGGEHVLGFPFESQMKVIQPDRLLYHTEQNTIWIVDPKTCQGSTVDRLLLAPIEFATQHYMVTLHELITEGHISTWFDLPADVRLGGMIHVACRKPTIKFCNEDRDSEEYEHVLQSGPRRGQTIIKRRYSGDPRWENYVRRCSSWYRGTDQYTQYTEQRETDPVVNLSYIDSGALSDENWMHEYHYRLSYLHDLGTVLAHPGVFLRPGIRYGYSKSADPLYKLYLAHVGDWPDLIRENRLIQWWRDEHLERQETPFLLERNGTLHSA